MNGYIIKNSEGKYFNMDREYWDSSYYQGRYIAFFKTSEEARKEMKKGDIIVTAEYELDDDAVRITDKIIYKPTAYMNNERTVLIDSSVQKSNPKREGKILNIFEFTQYPEKLFLEVRYEQEVECILIDN